MPSMIVYPEARNDAVTVSTSSVSISQGPAGQLRRRSFVLTNTGSAVITLSFGSRAAVAGKGYPLQPNATYGEATDGGLLCWQGDINAIGTGSGDLAVLETFEVSPPQSGW